MPTAVLIEKGAFSSCLLKKRMLCGFRFDESDQVLCHHQCHAGGERGGGRQGMGWGLVVFVGPRVGHLTDLVLPGEGIFESFFARRGDI